MKVRACGILFCYNEEDIIQNTLEYYLRQGIDLVVFDNQSTDSSRDIINSFFREKNKYAGQLLDLVTVKTEGYQHHAICRNANDYMHEKLKDYDWIMVIDADEHYASPIRDLSLLDYLNTVKKYGYNIIHGRAYYFYPTEKDDPSIVDYGKRIKYCQRLNKCPQEKIFSYHPSINFFSYGGHCCLRDDRRVCLNPGFILKHYGWVSYEQGIKKVFRDRLPRYKNDSFVQNQYAYMLPEKRHFIKDSHSLSCYDEEKELISKTQFSLITKIISVYDLVLSKFPGKVPAILRPYSANPPVVSTLRSARPVPYYVFSNIIDRIIAPDLRSAKEKYEVDAPPLGYPSEICFLMTNLCNAKCLFCNQPAHEQNNEITLDKFKIFVSHIPMYSVRRFVFSGGGEPLLSRDLFDIIRYVNSGFPHVKISIRTNGLLIEKFAAIIAELDIDRLEISIHGTEEINNGILQVNNSGSIFSGLIVLKEYERKANKKIFKSFCPIVSRINVHEIPKLIQKASELGIDEVRVGCCLYYPHQTHTRLKQEDSVFFHRSMHDTVIRQSVRMAKKLKIGFSPTRLFSRKCKTQLCSCPWHMMLVDWDGDVYPCPGGEARFYKKVKSGAYHFGNLLREDVSIFWVNEVYTKLRRHLRVSSEKHIPECDACHLSICYKGPHVKESHIIPEI